MEETLREDRIFESDNIKKIILKLAPPIMLAQLIRALYNIIDSFFIGRYSDEGLTALSLIFPIQLLMTALAVGTGVGVNTIISFNNGMNKSKEALKTAKAGTVLGFINYVVFAVISILIMKSFIGISTQNNEVYNLSLIYGNIVCAGSIGLFMESIWTKILQAEGNMKLPMKAQIAGAVVNIVLDPVLIFGVPSIIPSFGIGGAAIASVIGQICAAVITGSRGFRGLPEDFNIKSKAFEVYRRGMPSIVMQSLYTVYIVGLNLILASFTESAVTVLGLYYKLQTFFFIPLGGLQNCTVPLISFNYAAKRYDKCREIMKFAIIICCIFMLCAALCFEIVPYELLSFFTNKKEVFDIGTYAFRIIGLSFIPAVFSLIIPVFFQALGKGKQSIFIIVLRQIILFVPLAWILSKFGLQYVWFTFPLSEIITDISAVYLFKKNESLV